MRLMKRNICCAIAMFMLSVSSIAQAGNPYEKYYGQYPQDEYIIGIGEAPNTGSKYAAKRIAEVLARRDMASQINVRTIEVSVDLMCSGPESSACKDEVVSIIETTVDEFLRGSRVVDFAESEGAVIIVVIMPREGISRTLEARIDGAVSGAKQNLDAARGGDKEALERARKQYMMARTYEIEQQILEGVRTNASKALKELEKELDKLRNQ